ncbi:hypothetical protein AMTR_s00066p00057280 [Amborella trichopoda]|uniref:Uncharacterized protein n=2 Tax=Amborella trichopoda TaxID=13333 RepID=U5DD30_AMBTC|nr:hypothetical protein AMTR_s00066p00057280 [Amborella trichopoda]
MALTFFSSLQNLWLLWADKDLWDSNRIVQGLSIPDHTKHFVFAIYEPESQSTVYILAAQILSECSAGDAECLIKATRPQAVVAQISPYALEDIQSELSKSSISSIPTSRWEVLKVCFMEKISKPHYEELAGFQVLKEIFGVGFYGHVLAAKTAAKEVNSCFLFLESPLRSSIGHCESEGEDMSNSGNLGSDAQKGASSSKLLPPTGLVPGRLISHASGAVSLGYKRFCVANLAEHAMVRPLVSSVALVESGSSDSLASTSELRNNYEAPPFAQSFYGLLTDLHDIYADIPAMRTMLVYAQKMLDHVNRGEDVHSQILSEVHKFRVAVEGLRYIISSTNKRQQSMSNVEYSGLSQEEKCNALFAQSLRNQAKKCKSLVAVVDASSLAGIRRHWNTSLPPEIAESTAQLFAADELGGEGPNDNSEKKSSLVDKPVVAVGAGATAVIGVSSLSKAAPASTFMKLLTYKFPASLKLGFAQAQRTAMVTLSKILSPSKVVAPLKAAMPGAVSSGAKATPAMKAAASAEKIRAVAHSVIASAERASLAAMRTAIYGIMKKRRGHPIGLTPWATFGCSVAAGTGLIMYGDGIECALESLPVASTIASLGQGLRSLQQVSQVVRETNSSKIQEMILTTVYNIRRHRIQ